MFKRTAGNWTHYEIKKNNNKKLGMYTLKMKGKRGWMPARTRKGESKQAARTNSRPITGPPKFVSGSFAAAIAAGQQCFPTDIMCLFFVYFWSSRMGWTSRGIWASIQGRSRLYLHRKNLYTLNYTADTSYKIQSAGMSEACIKQTCLEDAWRVTADNSVLVSAANTVFCTTYERWDCCWRVFP